VRRAPLALALVLAPSLALAGCDIPSSAGPDAQPIFSVSPGAPSPGVVITAPSPFRPDPSPPQGNPAPD
jgi:hypothetical protein